MMDACHASSPASGSRPVISTGRGPQTVIRKVLAAEETQ